MTANELGKKVQEPVDQREQLDYHALNAMLNLYNEAGEIQFDKDREAANQYFLQHVNQNTVYFHDLEEKIKYLIDNEYYDPAVLDQYEFSFVSPCSSRPTRRSSASSRSWGLTSTTPLTL